MIASDSIRYGMIGAGAISQAYLRAFQLADSAELIAVADVRAEAARATAETAACAWYEDYREMLGQSELDAVLVVTPPATHEALCVDALRAGHHVLCEKPLATTPAAARRMVAAAVESERLFTMASKFRHVDDVIRAKAMVASGMLGHIVLFENTFTGMVDMSQRWNSDPQVSGGGVLIDNGTHSVDLIRFFLGRLAELQVVEGQRLQELSVEDTVRLFARTVDGVMASVDLSWSLQKQQPYYLSLYCDRGTIHIGWQESRFRRSHDGEWSNFGQGYDKHRAFAAQLENFSQAILGRAQLTITWEDALASVDTIHGAYDAMRQNRWISIPNGHAQHSADSTKRPVPEEL